MCLFHEEEHKPLQNYFNTGGHTNGMVKQGEEVLPEYKKWTSGKCLRVTNNYQKDNTFVRCPFTLNNSLPQASERGLVQLTAWETSLRAIEEHLMISLFGMLMLNVIWASILAKVMERTSLEDLQFSSWP